MQAVDIMTSKVVTVELETTVEEIARTLLSRHISAVPVIDSDGMLQGIVSEGDLMRRPESETERQSSWWLRQFTSPADKAREFAFTHGRHARDVMSSNVLTVSEDTPAAEIAALLEKHRIKRVPVVRDGHVVGIVSRANLLQGLAATTAPSEIQADDRQIRSELEATLHREFPEAAQNVSCVVTDGIVRLWGATMSHEEKNAIRIAAESLPGVSKVDDNITVFPNSVRAAMGSF